ncbi:MAG: ATP-binding protein [Desulfobacterota bacterium]|nr:ATP-binding protein [Thermodesulfobacteriota bacterium]
MYFVGRFRETRFIINTLRRGEHVVIAGRFGMGRTSLVRHVSRVATNAFRFVFVDFSSPPADICRQLLMEMFPHYAAMHNPTSIPYKHAIFHLFSQPLEDPRPHVLVLDNIERLSRQKLIFLRRLASEKRFTIIAIIATSLPEHQYQQVRVALLNMRRLSLGHLDKKSTREYFTYCSSCYGFNWTDDRIKSLCIRTQGYPLSMKEIVDNERRALQLMPMKEDNRADMRH